MALAAALVLLPLLTLESLLLLARLLERRRPESPSGSLPRPGLWLCSHRAEPRYPFQHLFIKITPRDPSWAQKRPDLFILKDLDGKAYATLGAGPRQGKLDLRFNRGYDLWDEVGFEKESPCASIEEENRKIEMLLEAAGGYKGGLAFSAWSKISGPGYNCNSMIRALAERSGLKLPPFCWVPMLCPGVGRPVPPEEFAAKELSLKA